MLRITLYSLVVLFTAATDCEFPANWHGSWMLNGFKELIRIEISRDNILGKGRCVQTSDSNKYLLLQRKEDEDDGQVNFCYSCLVFTERHTNVIQYKEAIRCNPEETSGNFMERLCSGDRLGPQGTLYTLIREHAVPVACPGIFQRPLQFEYARGDDFCLDDPSESELSKISQCASDRRMKMEFGRCQDPVYSRSDFEFECLANWEAGGSWLYVKSGANEFRCMYYDITSKALGMSEDASCIGLTLIPSAPVYISWIEGRTIARPESTCLFPSWFNRTEWTDLQAEYIYRFDHQTKELVVDQERSNMASQRHTCVEKISGTQYVTKVVNGCDQGYQCLIFKQKSATVSELLLGEIASSAEDACSGRRVNSPWMQTKLLRDVNAGPIPCPVQGVYPLDSAPSQCPSTMEVSCASKSTVVIKQCNNMRSELVCMAQWKDRRVNRLIISKKSFPRSGNCYKYRVKDGETVIEIDEQCNHNAPLVLDSSQPHPPFRLSSPTKTCENANGNDGFTDNYKISDQSSEKLSMHSSSEGLCLVGSLLIPTFLMTIYF